MKAKVSAFVAAFNLMAALFVLPYSTPLAVANAVAGLLNLAFAFDAWNEEQS